MSSEQIRKEIEAEMASIDQRLFQKFRKYDQDNPHVYQTMERFALEAYGERSRHGVQVGRSFL